LRCDERSRDLIQSKSSRHHDNEQDCDDEHKQAQLESNNDGSKLVATSSDQDSGDNRNQCDEENFGGL
jgi:hypothetical protein